jgi:UDP-N-acetylmuramate: L-alanyl-gamma-D-glutamyl-meso-diaminopimelate ligase
MSCKGRWVLAVAGTHGKTTTAAMLAWILEHAGLESRLPDWRRADELSVFPHGSRGQTPWSRRFFVIEADEYDTAFCDKRSKFGALPRADGRSSTISNSIMLTYLPDLPAIETQFHHLVRTLPRQGLIVSNAAAASLEDVLGRGCWTPVERFDDPAGWRAVGSDVDGSLALLQGEQEVGRMHWSLTGDHNRSNAVAALLAARHVGVPLARGLTALSRFENVKRRLELRGTVGGISVYDDFAHHPTAVATTVAGLRRKVGGARILAVLEPRSNTMKLGIMKSHAAGESG